MKKILLPLIISVLSACNGGGGSQSNNNAGIPSSIIGSWELESYIVNGVSTKADRPDPNNPYADRNISETQQLKIDEENFSQISTDFVHYSVLQLPYRIEDNKIVTIDEENFEMTDYIVHSVSNDTLVVEPTPKENNPQGVKNVYKRINEDQLATKTAQTVTYEEHLKVTIEHKGDSIEEIEVTSVGPVKYDRNGPQSYILCWIDNDDKLYFSYGIDDVSEGAVSTVPIFSIVYDDIKPDLKGPEKSMTSQSTAHVMVESARGKISEEVTDCNHKIDRKGATLQLSTSCKRESDEGKITLQGSCLLRHSIW